MHSVGIGKLLQSPEWINAQEIVIDFDGVIGATEEHQMRAFHFLIDNSSVKIPVAALFEFAKELLGKTERSIVETLMSIHGLKEPLEELLDLRAQVYLDTALAEVEPNPLTLQILKAAKEAGKTCIILSNGRSNILDQFIEKWNIGEYFAERQTADKRKIADKTKYLIDRAKKVGRSHGQFLILEDSRATIEKAQDEGFSAVFFTHALNAHNHGFAPKSGIVYPCINPKDTITNMVPDGDSARESLIPRAAFPIPKTAA